MTARYIVNKPIHLGRDILPVGHEISAGDFGLSADLLKEMVKAKQVTEKSAPVKATKKADDEE